jgi:epoxyqueuosine reductase QueG
MIVDEIRRIADAEGVAVLGFGPASAMADEPIGYRPEDLLPGAKGLLCFGLPLPRAVYQTPTHTAEVICRAQSHNYRRLDTLSIRFAALLEERGEQALPIFGCAPMGINKKGDVDGYLNQIGMGEATGIGVIGRNGLLIHSRYGARLMLGSVVTTADFPQASYPRLAQTGCPPDCRICVDACPANAISLDEKRVKVMRCLGYTSRTPLMSKPMFVLLRAFRPAAAARLMNRTALDEHVLHVCSRCVALCPYGEEPGRASAPAAVTQPTP